MQSVSPKVYILRKRFKRYNFYRYDKANNKYLKSYNRKEEPKQIKYLDVNKLYGYAMSKFFTRNKLEWIDLKMLDLKKYTSNSPNGFVVEVDLQYPKELRELHKDYPLVPDNKKILSDYQLKVADLYNIPVANFKKLVSNLFDKEKYIS